MVIQNKKTKRIEEVSQGQWVRMKELRMDTKFVVIDPTDRNIEVTQVLMPEDIREILLQKSTLTENNVPDVQVSPVIPDDDYAEVPIEPIVKSPVKKTIIKKK